MNEERAARISLEKLVKTMETKLVEEVQARQKLEIQIKELFSKISLLSSGPKKVKRVKATFDYAAEEDNELGFNQNDVLEIIKEDSSGILLYILLLNQITFRMVGSRTQWKKR